jgi:hypothetical protein
MGAVVLVTLLVLSGCKPSAPSESGWQSSAEQAVADMVSEVATSRLTVEQDLHGRFVGHYAVVVLTYSEEAAGKASDSVSTLQPPPSAHPGYDELTGLLSDANDAISQARISVSDGNDAKSRAAIKELTQVLAKLRPLQDRLERATR